MFYNYWCCRMIDIVFSRFRIRARGLDMCWCWRVGLWGEGMGGGRVNRVNRVIKVNRVNRVNRAHRGPCRRPSGPIEAPSRPSSRPIEALSRLYRDPSRFYWGPSRRNEDPIDGHRGLIVAPSRFIRGPYQGPSRLLSRPIEAHRGPIETLIEAHRGFSESPMQINEQHRKPMRSYQEYEVIEMLIHFLKTQRSFFSTRLPLIARTGL